MNVKSLSQGVINTMVDLKRAREALLKTVQERRDKPSRSGREKNSPSAITK